MNPRTRLRILALLALSVAGLFVGSRAALAAPEPSSATPNSAANAGAGAGSVAVTIGGTGFTSDAQVTLEKTGQTTIAATGETVINATTMTATLNLTSVAPGEWDIRVTQGDGSGVCAGCFTVTADEPTVASASPSSRGQGAEGTITISGTNFFPGAVASFSGSGITVTSTTHVSTTEVQAAVTIAAGATTGARDITVTNTDDQFGLCTGCFTVNTGPKASSISPSVGANTAAVNTTITGSGFDAGTTVSLRRAGQANIAGTNLVLNSATSLSARFDIAAAAPGTWTVRVENADGGAGTCACFTIAASAPTVTGVTPGSLGQGATAQDLTVTGTNFAMGAAASFSGAGVTDITTTFVSATSLTVTVTVDAAAATGARNLTITNTDSQAGTCTGCFSVNAAPTATSAAPPSRGQGAASQDVVISGTGFRSGATVAFSGTDITVNSVTFGSDTSLTANISVDVAATVGARDITVTNPDAATPAVCTGCFAVNAAPTVASATPSSRGQGAATQDIVVAGTGFVDGAAVSFSGTGITVHSTTFGSATEVTASVTIDAGATASARDLTVTNPDAGAATCTACFTVAAGPSTTSAAPANRGQGAAGQTVVLTGTGYVNGATVAIGGEGVTVDSVTFDSTTQLTIVVTVDGAAAAGARDITVANPDAGVHTCTGCFTVNAAPTVTSASPNDRGQGAASHDITISGTGFLDGAAATFGDGITVNSTTYLSATSLTANISVDAAAATGARTITVTNPDGATAATCADCFTVVAAPTATGATPASRGQGASSQSIVIAGTGFRSGASVDFSTNDVTVDSVSVDSATSLTAVVTVDDAAATGLRDVTVTNPDGATPAVCADCFTVNAAPAVTAASPSSRGQGASAQTVTLTGTGFSNADGDPTVSFDGAGVTVNSVTYGSSTSLTVNVTVANDAAPGARSITLTNADQGSAVCSACFTVNAKPAVTAASPDDVAQGAQNRNVQITGSGFASGATVTLGAGITVNSTTFGSATSLTVNVSVSDSAALGTRDITVTNADAGAGSCSACFSVTGDPAPNSVSPSAAINSGSVNATITGAGFVSGATVLLRSSGQSDIPGTGVVVDSATQIRATFDITAAAPKTWTMVVTNPDDSTGTCDCFSVAASAPDATAVSPSTLGQGASETDVTVSGTSFARGDAVTFSGGGITVHSTTFVSATELTANVSIDGSATIGARDLTVTHADSQSDTCTGCFTVSVKPLATGATPSSRGQGATTQQVTLSGSGFQTGATVVFSGTGITVDSTTVDSATSATLEVSIAADAAAGARAITVTNTDGGTGTCSGCFTVNAAPGATGATPSSRGQGAATQDVTIAGTGFISGAAITFSGAGITVHSTTFVSATSLTANISVDAAAAPGARTVTVTNPDGATPATCTGCFTVDPTPTVTSASPSSRGQGAATEDIQISGTGFLSGATAAISGADVTVHSTTVDSATSLTVSISVGEEAATGSRSITVTNDNAGAAGTCTDCFTVNAKPSATGASPATVGQGASAVDVDVTGTGFQDGATASVGGTGVTVDAVAFSSSTSLTVTITVDGGAATGARNLTVSNPDGATPAVCTGCVTISAAPAVTGASPSSRGQGVEDQDITITGTGFVDGAVASFGDGVTVSSTTFVSATELTANISVADAAAAGTRSLAVTNPDAGVSSCADCFTVTSAPVVTGTAPSTRSRGSGEQDLVLTGTGFQDGATVAIASGGITVNEVTFASATSLTVGVTVSDSATVGAHTITVTNPDGGDGACADCFSVTEAGAATITTTTALTGTLSVAFDKDVSGVTTSNLVLRLTGTSDDLDAYIGCRDADDAVSDCADGPVRSATLRTRARRLPGQYYTMVVNPDGATAMRDSDGGPVTQTSSAFRASLSEEERSSGVVTRWRTVGASGAYGRSYTVAHQNGASGSFRFTGTRVTWYPVFGPTHGLADVLIDGVRKARVDLYASSVRYGIGRTFDVPDGTHTIRILARGARSSRSRGTYVGIDAFRVTGGSGTKLYASPVLSYGWPYVVTASASDGRYARESLAGASVRMTFRGTAVHWYTVTAANMGKAAVYIDGVRVVTIDNYSSSTRYNVRRSIRGLSDGIHTIEIRVLGTKRAASKGTYVAVDRIAVG